jgi:MoxR-like ATPase
MTDSRQNAAIEESIEKLNKAYHAIRDQMSKVIVGQSEVVDQLLIALFSRGHCLLEGVPGLAKTLMISTLARCLSMSFSRIQFTPDLMPADIAGTDVLQENKTTGQREFRFLSGPLFHNVVLADEINRTPPKTQAALLEAMQERQVTVGQVRHILNDPFFVLATQNPIEQEGTYALPEAQQDRFMFKVFVRYPSFAEERQVAKQTTGIQSDDISTVLNTPDVLELQRIVRQVPVTDHVVDYALALVRQTRVGEDGCPTSSKNGSAGGPARGPCSFCSWAARLGRSCTGEHMFRRTTWQRWRPPCCGTGLSPILPRKVRACLPTA